MQRKICVLTGSRAEYGLLYWLMKEITCDPVIELQLVVTCMHLSAEFGFTYREIEKDGFTISRKVEMLLSSDSPVGVAKSMGLGMIVFAEAFHDLKPDILVLLGDRFELLAAASAALIAGIPIAHIHGGEITLGAFDEAIRHSITKMSHLHFTSTDEYRRRVIQLGEHPHSVFNVGALGIENVRRLSLLSKEELVGEIGFDMGEKCLLVTFHPVTLEHGMAEEQFSNLLDAIDGFPDIRTIFTKANADTEGRVINRMIDDYVGKNKQKAVSFTSMGQIRYLSALKCVDAVVGNSSSGIIEAPSVKTPTVNIGDRQKGRVRAGSVVDCEPRREDIARSLRQVLSPEFREKVDGISNPYEKEDTALAIKETIKRHPLDGILLKAFHDVIC